MKTWTTKTGEEIPYNKLEDSHLLNILQYVKKLAKELDGEIIDGGGFTHEDFWYDTGDEEDWLRKFDYQGLLEEAKKRNLPTKI